jgi:hypothetical protein
VVTCFVVCFSCICLNALVACLQGSTILCHCWRSTVIVTHSCLFVGSLFISARRAEPFQGRTLR